MSEKGNQAGSVTGGGGGGGHAESEVSATHDRYQKWGGEIEDHKKQGNIHPRVCTEVTVSVVPTGT